MDCYLYRSTNFLTDEPDQWINIYNGRCANILNRLEVSKWNKQIDGVSLTGCKDASISTTDEQKQFEKPTNTNKVEESPATTTQYSALTEIKDVEDTLKRSLNLVLKRALPYFVRNRHKVKLSPTCSASIMKTVFALRKLEVWAIKMIDSSGKIPGGVLTGTMADMGSYNECLDISVRNVNSINKNMEAKESFRGKYCFLEFEMPSFGNKNLILNETPKLPANNTHSDTLGYWFYYNLRIIHQSPLMIGVCVPSTCSKEDVYNVASVASKAIYFPVSVPRCEVKTHTQLSTHQLVVLCFLGAIGLMVLVGTSFDLLHRRQLKNKLHIQGNSRNPCRLSLKKVVTSFSILSNTERLFCTISCTKNSLGALHGIRFLSALWVVLGHTYFLGSQSTYRRYRGLLAFHDFGNNFIFGIVENFTVAVDSFFLVSGLLLIYSNWNKLEKNIGKLFPIHFCIHKVWRMTPVYMLIVGLAIILPLLGSGPWWNETINPEYENCRNYWWRNLLFVNNLFHVKELCMLHTWYMSSYMQIYSVSLVTLLLIYRWPVLGWICNLLLLLGGAVLTGVVTYSYNLPPATLFSVGSYKRYEEIMTLVYIKPYSHVGAFCVGVGLGYFINRWRSILLTKKLQVLGWSCSTCLCLLTLCGPYQYRRGTPMHPVLTAVYAACHRTGWALGVSWVAFVCISGYGDVLVSREHHFFIGSFLRL
ncbi:nose resistant to fluoxetine protein 6-like isoform X3 [Tachypleus tridentatus]|uniref:nose resistant to fluoxetine protein 6-like isoform X3 n=1 Tax=Tachypleus tridentatus TaxID=6853 RepID=UPI003FD07E5E